MKPCKAGITCQSPLLKRLRSTLNLILQFRTRQQTAHLQTILASMQRDALKSRVIVMLDSGDLPFKEPYFRRNPTSIVLQSKNTWQNRNQRIGFAQEHFFRPHQP